MTELAAEPVVPEVIYKVIGACNLACTYCYQTVGTHEDFRSLNRPVPLHRFAECMEAVAAHTVERGGARFNLVLQGGEPLLAGVGRVEGYVQAAHAVADRHAIAVTVSVQTNGTLIDQRWIKLFRDYGVGLALSIDGNELTHDARRVRLDGSGSFEQIRTNVAACVDAGVPVGALCVMTPHADGAQLYQLLVEMRFKIAGLLFPAHNYACPDSAYAPGSYASFLKSFFDSWWCDDGDFRVHNFDAMIRSAFGSRSSLAGIGSLSADIITFAPDGTVESGDAYGICSYERLDGLSPSQGIAVASSTEIARLLRSGGFVPTECQCEVCPVATTCGGGMLEHRYSPGRGFNNPSYYCADLMDFYVHVASRLDLARV